MAIIKSTNNKLRSQVNSQYKTDRVPKSIFCILYGIDKEGATPSSGKLAIGPTRKPSQATSIQINTTTLTGANVNEFLKFSTEGSLIIYEKALADNFTSFKVKRNSTFSNDEVAYYDIPKVLSSDAISILTVNSQVCVNFIPAPTSEAFGTVDGGYY